MTTNDLKTTIDLDANGEPIVPESVRRRIGAEDKAEDALFTLAMLGELVDVARDGELTLTSDATQGMCLTLDRAQGALRNLLEVLKAERKGTAEA